MAWKKYFTTVPSQARLTARLAEINKDNSQGATTTKFSSYLPEVYAGAPNRVERYVAYEQADLDSEINRSLDTIAEFCTQNQSDDEPIPFRFIWKGDVTETETELLTSALQQWCSINKLNQRIFKIFRNTVKYGDQFFIRDPETYELLWVDSAKVEKIIVNEAQGKKIEQYVIRDLDFNLQSLVATNPLVHDQYSFPGGYPRSANPAAGAGNINYGQPTTPGGRTSRFYNPANSMAIDANHVVHLSLSEGLDQYWPFGTSIIEAVYKTYKQKDLLEDCILIYRIVRAPERRVFKIDVGQLQGQRAMQYVERVKNEIYQRRLPSRTGGGACITLDTQIPLLDGRTLALSDIITEFDQGKKNWVYSVDPNSGAVCPGPITWAGVTRKNTQVIRLTLDNGETIVCTPDHKIPVVNKGKVEAKDIEVGKDSLFSFNTRLESINERENSKDPQYHQVFDHQSKKWKFTHRVVAHFLRESDLCQDSVFDPNNAHRPKRVIHHIDWNKHNNAPENLTFMNHHDHLKLHAMGYRDWYATLSEEQKEQLKKKNSEGVKASRQKDPGLTYRIAESVRKTYEGNPSLRIKQSHNATRRWESIKADKDKFQDICNRRSATMKKTHMLNPELNWPNQSIVFDQKLFDAIVESVSAVGPNLQKVVDYLNKNSDIMTHFQRINVPQPGKLYKIRVDQLSREVVTKCVKDFGYDIWTKFTASQGYGIEKKTLSLKWDHRQISILADMIVADPLMRKSEAAARLNNNSEFVTLMQQLNSNTKGMGSKNNIAGNAVHLLISNFGYKNWTDFKSKVAQFNHKVTKIEWLDNLTDTGTITVDGQEQYHAHHTFAVAAGVFIYNSIIDTAYNPISITEDFFLATNSEQRGTTIDTLNAGENLGTIDDLKYFNNKLMRGLGIPSSYLPTGPDDGTAVYNDGKVGTAFIQEYRFNKYCQRLQNSLAPTLDMEFKLFLKFRGIEVHSSLYELAFNVPQSFSQYRNMSIDTERVNLFSSAMNSDARAYMSKRYALKRYLGWTEEDILENERMWKEENNDKVKGKTGTSPIEDRGVGLGSIGIRPSPEPDFGMGGPEMPPEAPVETPGFETPEVAPGAETPPTETQ